MLNVFIAQDTQAGSGKACLAGFRDADGMWRYQGFDASAVRWRDGGASAHLALDAGQAQLHAVAGLERTIEPDGGSAWSGVLDADGRALACHLELVPGLALSASGTHGEGVRATRAFSPRETVLVVRGPKSPAQTRYSFRWRGGGHVEPSGFGHFVNHSCLPNCRISYDRSGRPILTALRRIEPGEEIGFDYSRTEGRLAGVFQCRCPADRHVI